jgi:hypothetical protein
VLGMAAREAGGSGFHTQNHGKELLTVVLTKRPCVKPPAPASRAVFNNPDDVQSDQSIKRQIRERLHDRF